MSEMQKSKLNSAAYSLLQPLSLSDNLKCKGNDLILLPCCCCQLVLITEVKDFISKPATGDSEWGGGAPLPWPPGGHLQVIKALGKVQLCNSIMAQ